MKVLVVVDMQNDFVGGVLGSKEAAEISFRLAEKIEAFDGIVVTTYDTHDANYLGTQEGSLLPVEHCIVGSDGWMLADPIREAIRRRGGEYKEFYKGTFGSTELGSWLSGLTKHGLEEVEFTGVCTDICVISNAIIAKAFIPEVPISVDASCCAGVTPESHRNALEAMKQCQIIIKNQEG